MSTAKPTPVPRCSEQNSESESEAETSQARAFRSMNEGGVETMREIRMSPDLFPSEEVPHRNSRSQPLEEVSGVKAPFAQRSSRTTHGRKQVLVNSALMEGEPELLFEYTPSPTKSAIELSSSGIMTTESGIMTMESETTSSSSPDNASPVPNYELFPMEYAELLVSTQPPYVPIAFKPKPSILQRSKTQPPLPDEKVKMDLFRPLIIEVPNPGGEARRNLPAILRSPGLGKQLDLENAGKSFLH